MRTLALILDWAIAVLEIVVFVGCLRWALYSTHPPGIWISTCGFVVACLAGWFAPSRKTKWWWVGAGICAIVVGAIVFLSTR